MSTAPKLTKTEAGPLLRLVPGRRREAGARVVAEVLADGTIRRVDGEEEPVAGRQFSTGRLSGDGWIIWWQRRTLDQG